MKKRLSSILIPGFLFLALTSNAAAQSALAVVSIDSGGGDPGDTVVLPVRLESQGGAEVTGVSFDLSFNGTLLSVSQIGIGTEASNAGKTMDWSPKPCTGNCSIIIVGINQNVIADGIIAQVSFDVLTGTSGGTSSLTLSNVIATDPSATPVPPSVGNGSFQVSTPTSVPTAPSTNTPVPTSTPTPTSTHTNTPGPSPTPTITLTPSITPTPSNTSPPTATHTPGPSPTASSTSSGTSTPGPSATASLTKRPTITQSVTSAGAGEGLELEGIAAATGTALAKFEGAVAATSTALAEEVAARPTDEIIDPETPSGVIQRPELFIAAGLLLLAIVLGGGAGYLAWRRQQE